MTLQELRELKGYTQTELARKAIVGYQTIRRAEQGIGTMRPGVYLRLCKALNVKRIDLVVNNHE